MSWNVFYPNSNPASGDADTHLNSPTRNSDCKPLPKSRNQFTLSNEPIARKEPAYQSIDQNDLEADFGSPSSIISELPESSENLYTSKHHFSTSRPLDDFDSYTFTTRGYNKECDATSRLIEENTLLTNDLEKSRKKVLGLKVSSAFALEAFRGQLRNVAEIRLAKQNKDEEAAARMTLHNLLLNSWRNCKNELHGLREDNVELHKSVENLSLQLRVVRHLQSVDKEKITEKSNEIERMKSKIEFYKDDTEKSHSSIEKMESELNYLQANIQNLQGQNIKYEAEIIALIEEIRVLQESVDLEKNKYGDVEQINISLNESKNQLDEELAEVTRQNNHWQERARAFESEAWGLKMDIETRNSTIKDIETACESLRREKSNFIRMKTALKDQLNETSDKLEQANTEMKEFSCMIQQSQFELNKELEKSHQLESALENSKQKYTEIEKELRIYKLRNVRRRREWANALYFMVNPIDAVRRSLSSQDRNGRNCDLSEDWNRKSI